MGPIRTLLSTVTTYQYSTTSLSGILLVILTSIAVFFLIPIIFRRRNWRNAPPGPLGWPILGYLPYLSECLHEDLFHLSKTYGPFFSLQMGQKPVIVVSSPEVAREILKHKEGSFSSRTITEAVRSIAYDGTTLVFVPYSERWRLLRKILTTELFSSRAIDLLQPARQQQVRGLLKSLYACSKSKTPVNIAESMFVVSTNLTSNFVCSKSLFDNLELKEMVRDVFEAVAVPNMADLIPFLKILDPQGLKKRVSKVAKKMDSFFENLIDERLEEKKKGIKINENGRLDLLDVFLDYKNERKDDDGLKQFSRVDIKGMLIDMFMAGSDTTSSTVEWGMAEILKKPEVHEKILVELEQVIGKNRFVEEADIPKLTYFQAAVKEIFRLHPAVPLLVPRRSNEACEVYGYHVPKHAIVFVNVWGIARDPKVWPEPLEFKPERFLESEMDVKGQDFEILPFGTGRRSCVGLPLGLRMVQYSLASLIHAFEWDIFDDSLEDMTEKVGITLQKAKVLMGIPKPRLMDSVYN
ncbi:flavonoid 3'-monooxygenase CYP75B137-like [Telopea speciosissima]|uniref:flavonoid 3'-monooxygenase CYP75B137-like n=1 Tax=Telopea speciosissima TaxID=54955 RepID=UPI001CC425F6|nr:flavonoid 3'-monooxygenase CYP75B137-like [Telopea speciosissima]